MGKFKRRQVLLAALTTGVAASMTDDYWRSQSDRQRQAELEALAEAQRNPEKLLQQAFQQDVASIREIRQITSSTQLTPPTLPYSREISQLLIQCNKLASQQYLKGKVDATYDGSLPSLPAYGPNLDRYQQIAAFRGVEAEIDETVDVNVPAADVVSSNFATDAVQHQADQTEQNIQDTIREAVTLRRKIPVYYGFVLTSETDNLILFRGTQRISEWIDNLIALQQDYQGPDAKQPYGKTHQGFANVYRQILSPLPPDIAKKLNPAVPCYISGHSLGAALATFAAIDIALKVPKIRPQLQLYTYASPRVGDAVFAKAHSQLVPNSFRVVNLGDMIPLVPPTQLNGVYVHIGQEWSFLSQNGDVLPNHVIDTYASAINRKLENHQSETYLNLLYDR